MIVGGGVSGLAAAFFLKQHGIDATLFEKSGRLGGLIRTHNIQGCQLEAGPDSYIATKRSVTELAAQLGGLKDEIIGSNDAQRRVYIVRDGKLTVMPPGMSMMVPGDLNAALKSELFSSNAKLRFLTEIFFPQHCRRGDVSVQELVESHFGPELLEYVTEPLLSGVYGGNSAQLSAESVLPRFVGYERDYGSLIRGVRRERHERAQNGSLFLSFRRGMQSLTDALSESVTALHEEVKSIERGPKHWKLRTASGATEAEHVVIAAPARAAASLLSDTASNLASELSGIQYSSAILVTLVFRKSEASIPAGFGFLVPRRERKAMAAATFVGTKWPDRVPSDLVVIRAFIVDPESVPLLDASDSELLELTRADLRFFLEVAAEPLFSTVERWPDSMPQYVVGHQSRCKRIAGYTAEWPGLHLIGNSYDGVGIPDCVRKAKETANAIGAAATV